MNSAASRSSLNRTTELKESEAQSKFVNERVNQIETYFGDLCSEFVSYTRRTAKLRNNGDELSKILLNYSVNEKINRTSAHTLKKFAELISNIEDYRHAEVDRLFAKVITPLSRYGDEVKKIRANLKAELSARKKEIAQLKRLGQNSFPSRAAEEQLHMATMDATRIADSLEREVIQFEAKKLKGLKDILTDFVHIEMLWHAKALETFSEAFNVVQSLQEESDLADFRSTLLRSGTFGSLDGDLPQGGLPLSMDSKSRSAPHLSNSATSLNSRGREKMHSLSRSRKPAGDVRKHTYRGDQMPETYSDTEEIMETRRQNQFATSKSKPYDARRARTTDASEDDEENEETVVYDEDDEDDDEDEEDEDEDESEEEEEADEDEEEYDEDDNDEDDDDEVTEDTEESAPAGAGGRRNLGSSKTSSGPLYKPAAAPLKPALKHSSKPVYAGR